MKPNSTRKSSVFKRRKGLALITVLSMMALITIIVMAFLTSADSEFQSTTISSNGEAARQLSENAVSLVVGQIQAGSRQVTNNGNTREFHATQPGVVRQYLDTGALYAGYKLYSDSTMIVKTPGVAGETLLANDAPADNWDAQPARYVDLNEPVVRAKAGSTVPSVFFPIVDPRAAHSGGGGTNDAVEGFQYFDKSNLGTGTTIKGVVTATGTAKVDDLRVPMPVEWLYVLKNGAMGVLNGAQKFVPMGAGENSAPSEDNPIVGRIAFWTDDESCKVNINTASEPAYWVPPYFYHERDRGFNDAPPVQFEYQRYPGHPATVALSSILFPNKDLDTYGLTGNSLNEVLDFRERIYGIAPKINKGGSRGGTLPFDPDDFIDKSAPPITIADVSSAMSERLYVSLDELRFSEVMAASSTRQPNELSSPSGIELLSPSKLERSRFFLTANSRSPEFSIFGVPRVAMWPIPVLREDATLGQNQTTYDKLIKFCATIKGSSGLGKLYAFQRQNAHHQFEDIELDRNKQLMSYLHKMMQKTWPGASSGGGASFETKYGVDDSRQILVEIFDYIRCINLYDSALSLEGKEIIAKADLAKNQNNLEKYQDPVLVQGGALAGNLTKLYEERDKLREGQKYITYTEPHYRTNRTDDGRGHGGEIPDVDAIENAYPGHGQVSPSRWNIEGKDYQGFGRNITVSEVGLHFICTADGKNDAGSFEPWADTSYTAKSGIKSGGRTAPKVTFPDDYEPTLTYRTQVQRLPGNAPPEDAYWYSNYPPYPTRGDNTIAAKYGIDWNDNNPASPRNPRNHPGINPANWNGSLERNKPLDENQRRIQCMLQIELFCPSVGWTGFDPEYTLVLDGEQVAGIEINGQAVFSTTAEMPIKSGRATYSAERFGNTAQRVGGTSSFRNIVANRRAKPIGPMTDSGYDSSTTSQVHGKLINMDFVSNFKTVDSTEFRFQVKKPLKIRVYDTHAWRKSDPGYREPIQEIEINFPTEEQVTPTPSLVTVSTPQRIVVNQTTGDITHYSATQAPRFWSFSYSGVMGRYDGSAGGYLNNSNSVILNNGTGPISAGLGGRLRSDAFGAAAGVPGGSHTSTTFNLPLKYYQKDNNDSRRVTVSHMGQLIWSCAVAQANGAALPVGDQFYKSGGIKINREMIGTENENISNFGFDVVRSMIPRYGDYRLMAARRNPPADQWVIHPMWQVGSNDIIMAHNMSAYRSDAEGGFDRSGDVDNQTKADYRLTTGANYSNDKVPDLPHNEETMKATNRYRDWDNGISNSRDGAYINKPDEGNFAKFPFWIDNAVRWVRSAYLFDTMESSSGSPAFFTPNRMISSPVMFGSLPTGVWGSKAPAGSSDMATNGVPWRTLLFRPHSQPLNTPVAIESSDSHPGATSPADHFLLDLFCMPVVEPYAISEPLSQAGRVNVNYQILPFTHIKRATGLHAVLKGELMAAIKRDDAPYYKVQVNKNGKWPLAYWSDFAGDPLGANTENQKPRNFYRKIDAAETVKQLDERFSHAAGTAGKQGLLRSASQFCELHLIPKDAPSTIPAYTGMNVVKPTSATNRTGKMNTFWDNHSLTGDNMKEKPYANIYSRITTRSDTFRVFVRAQVIQKARSAGVDTIDLTKDKVVGEYRGSRLLERYIDPSSSGVIPDYATQSDPYGSNSLEEYYRFRVLEAKRFDP